MGLSYLIERGHKRARRLEAAKAATAVTRAQVTDNERGVAFQVGSLFINAQLAESTLELAETDVKSFQKTVDISEIQYKDGGMSENDYLKIKIQLVQFETDVNRRWSTSSRRCRTSGNNWVMNRCPPITTWLANSNTGRWRSPSRNCKRKPCRTGRTCARRCWALPPPTANIAGQGEWQAGSHDLRQLLAR
jgi:hypothetical protein